MSSGRRRSAGRGMDPGCATRRGERAPGCIPARRQASHRPWLPALRLLMLAATATATVASAGAQIPPLDCSPPHRIDWPADHPVWSLCWISPDESSGIDGSGLELRDVYFKGKLVLRRAGVPVINVDYDPGGCGSYRDWQHALMGFTADHPLGGPGSRYAEPTAPPQTMCDHPGLDAGDFAGVAAYKTARQLVLTTQVQAGPYRYVHTWTFWPDGSIDARIAFTSRFDPCNQKAHDHHAYWRLELDPGGGGKDYAEEAVPGGGAGPPRWMRFRTEASRRSDPARGGDWRVHAAGGSGYEILSPPGNGVAGAWAVADFWVLAFHPEEIDDGGARPGPRGGAVQLDRYLDGEPVDGARLVVWLHATARHEGSTRCRFVGPTLRPIGDW